MQHLRQLVDRFETIRQILRQGGQTGPLQVDRNRVHQLSRWLNGIIQYLPEQLRRLQRSKRILIAKQAIEDRTQRVDIRERIDVLATNDLLGGEATQGSQR